MRTPNRINQDYRMNHGIRYNKLFSSPEVESDNLSESDIGPFDILYGEIDEDNFHQKMESNDLTYYPLFSDKEFLNEDWHNYKCIESCATIEDVRHWMRVSWDRYSEYQRN